MRILAVESLRFPGEGSSAQGKSGPKERPKGVSDGQQVDIPALRYNRTVGTQRDNTIWEWKDQIKGKRRQIGQIRLSIQSLMRSEN